MDTAMQHENPIAPVSYRRKELVLEISLKLQFAFHFLLKSKMIIIPFFPR